MIATPAMLRALEPGELVVKVFRDGWVIQPNHLAIARANAALANPASETDKPGVSATTPAARASNLLDGPYGRRDRALTIQQRECLAGAHG